MEYTAHVQLPDASIGVVLHDVVLGHGAVSCTTLRSGSGTWLSFGFHADSDDEAAMTASTIRYHSSHAQEVTMPSGYTIESLRSFESAPMIVTSGRVVIHSEGI
jgi:hypothetical protein